ncbi:phenylacetate--CoA ligase family protein, partial [Thermodesulfobacteriota bacterium]
FLEPELAARSIPLKPLSNFIRGVLEKEVLLSMKTSWDETFETMPLEEMRKFQLEMPNETVSWVHTRVPFYRERFKETGLEPGDVKNLEDIAKLPFTEKTDLRDNYLSGLWAVPIDDVVQVHASSGTTGKPTTGPYTEVDLEQWTECCTRVMWAQGFRPDDVCQNGLTMGLLTGGLGLHQAIRRIGCAIVPTGGGLTERQIMLMEDLGVTAFCSTPSYALTVAEKAAQIGVDLTEYPLRLAIVGAEPFTPRDEAGHRATLGG